MWQTDIFYSQLFFCFLSVFVHYSKSSFVICVFSNVVLITHFCSIVQIQVVEDGSSATSPDTPESGIAKTLKQKGEQGQQLILTFLKHNASK